MELGLGNNISNLPAPKVQDTTAASRKSDRDFQNSLEASSTSPGENLPKSTPGSNVKPKDPQNPEASASADVKGLNTEAPVAKKLNSEAQNYIDAKNGQVTQLTRQGAMEAFLARMETEVGVEPSDVLEAFAKLDAAQLMAPPEASAEQFVRNLEVPEDKQEKAFDIYSQFLAWTATASFSQQLQNENQNAKVEVMTPEQAALKERLAGLDQLNNKFFMQGEFAPVKKSAQTGLQAYGREQKPQDNAGYAGLAALKSQAAQSSGAPTASSASPTAFDISGMGLEDVASEPVMKMDLPQTNPVNAAMKAAYTEAASAAVMPDAAAAETAFSAAPASGMEAGASVESVISALSSLATGTDSDALAGDSSEQEGAADGALDADIADLGTLKTNGTQSAKFVMEAPKPTDAQMSDNIREIINGAQVMVKDGGGEMKVRLTPEGMGEVNLKVMVQNGEVNVEMIASNNETKKLLEKGLADLKANLATHKLNVDQIKVETAQSTSNQMQMDQQDMSERNFQQRFLQDFQQHNSQRRFDMMGFGPARMPSSQTREDATNDFYNPDNRKKRIDRRLDLVA